MSMVQSIRIAMVKRGNISGAELARRLGVSSQNLSNKMKRDNFSEQELVEIADALDCDVKITLTFRDTGEEL